MDLLDTSAFLAIPKVGLERASRCRDVALSPIAFWEPLSHLDEVKPKESPEVTFQRVRGNLLKVKYARMLEDPLTYYQIKTGAVSATDQSLMLERSAFDALILALEESSNPSELRDKFEVHATGEASLFMDCARKARDALIEKEKKFAESFGKLRVGLDSCHSDFHVASLTDPRRFYACVERLVLGESQSGQWNENIITSLSSLFLFVGCWVGLLMEQASSARKHDSNDFEDAFTCVYLDIFRDDILVTNDKKLRNAVDLAVSAFNCLAPNGLKSNVRSLMVNDYLALIRSART